MNYEHPPLPVVRLAKRLTRFGAETSRDAQGAVGPDFSHRLVKA